MDPTIGDTPTAEPEVIDVAQDSEVEKISDTGETETEEESTGELDITDLVNSQKTIEQKQTQYFDSMFQQLNQLQTKLSEMDGLVHKLNDIESKIEKYRPKTPEEKLELRSLDSGPYHQKLSDFFDDKQEDMKKTGKNEYVLTSDEVEQFTPSEISKTFDDYGAEPTGSKFKMN
jgi:TolA-binding protein